MNIGGYDITAISGGNFGLDGGAMFGIIPKPLWEKQVRADDRNRIDLTARVLLVRGHGRNILVDTGLGNKWSGKHRDIYKIDPASLQIQKALADLGLDPGDITDVILTHLHFDHAGGATREENGELIPAFPNATYYIQRKNWEWANNPSPKDAGSYRKENFVPLQNHGVLEFVEGEEEIFPRIRLFLSDGHTRAQQLPLIRDGEETLFYSGDLIPTAVHLPLPWVMGYDNFPLKTIEEKEHILNQAADEHWILFLEHDPGTAALTVRRTEKGVQAKAPVQL